MSSSLRASARPARIIAAAIAAATALALFAASAPAAVKIWSGSIDWTQTNVYRSSAPANTERTWLGFTTNVSDMGAGPPVRGSVFGTAGAWGTAVSGLSARGVDAVSTLSFGVRGGSYDPATGVGAVEGVGTITFDAPGNGQVYTIENPLVVFDGSKTARLYASGRTGNGGLTTYGHSGPIFNLDLTSAQQVDAAGARTITGIVPSIATANLVFPSAYAVGAGPNRTPNTFGSFALTLRLTAPNGTVGEAGSKRGSLPRVTLQLDGASEATVVLRKHVRKGGKVVAVRVGTVSKKVDAAGTSQANVALTDAGRQMLRRHEQLSVAYVLTTRSTQGVAVVRGAVTLPGSKKAA